jgi:hypothetical protein
MPRETRARIVILLPIPKTMPQFFDVLDVLDELERTSGGVTVAARTKCASGSQ